MQALFHLLFAPVGRMRRLYFVVLAVLSYAFAILWAALAAIEYETIRTVGPFTLLGGTMCALSVWILFAVSAKRFQDMGFPWFWGIAMLIPVVDYGILLWLALAKGTIGPNRYGPDPKRPERKGVGTV